MADESTKQPVPPPAPPPPPEEPLVKPDVVSEDDVAAVVGILIKTARFDRKLAANRKAVEELNKEIASDTLLRAKGVNALNVFGFDSTQNKVWTAVREVIGQEAYQRGLDIASGKLEERIRSPIPNQLVKDTTLLAEAVEAFRSNQPVRAEHNTTPKIADAILAFMRDRGSVGVKAAELRAHLKTDYGIDTHEKTPGMTLYRLSKDNLVRRDGRLWFAIDPAVSDDAKKNTATDQ